MKSLKLCITPILITLAVGIPAAHAQGFYVDGGYALVSTDLEGAFETDVSVAEADLDLDFDFDTIGGHIGYAFSPYLAVEGEFLVGISDESRTLTASDGESEIEATVDFGLNAIYGVYGVGSFPISDQFSAFLRAGYVYGEAEADATIGDESASDTAGEYGYGLGVGGTFNVTEQLYIRGDFTVYDIEETQLDMFMVGVGFAF
ncbi:MAG: porin family protein [Pseudomonadota bacterium]